MKNKIKLGLLVLSASMILTACSKKDKTEDLSKPDDSTEVVEETTEPSNETEEDSIHIERKIGEVNIDDYNYSFRDEGESEEFTIIYSENFDIDKMEFIRLEFAEDDLQEVEVLSTIENIKKGEKVLINAVYPEGIPMLKIKWVAKDKGIEDEYIIQYNGKDGVDDNLEIRY